ncbi:MAG: hypothetical protein ACJA2R_000596 [Saprospiraceae bacterium]|jgi:hypothetical protein|tara:strand:- start:5791 stop:6039 length:249 start_codon:yes stop_codon:yes gene_type:complete
MNSVLTLYVGSNCHLCEQAKRLIIDVLDGTNFELREINITSSELLFEKYKLRIPVIVSSEGLEKAWPFTSWQVRALTGLNNK